MSLLLISMCSLLLAPEPTATASPVGKKVEDFRLQDYRGGWHSLGDCQAKVVVVAFLGIECPLVKVYAPRLVELAREFGPRGVEVIAINPNRQDSVTEMASFARRHGMEFAMLKDVGNKVADALGVERTPEFFVLDPDRIIRYHGRFDDQYGVGYIRPVPSKNSLRDAVTEVLEGKGVTLAETPTPGCLIGRTRVASASAGEITYCNQVARIFQKRCLECHRDGQIGPFALSDYEEVSGWSDMIAEVVDNRRMPPWHADPAHGDFANSAQMPDDERQVVLDWVAAGAPQGDPKDLPAPVSFAEGWRIPEPDLVLEMTEEHALPAEGEIPYEYYVMDPALTEDKWVTAAECVAGNPAVVHHIIAFVVEPELAKELPVGHFSAPAKGNVKTLPSGRKAVGLPGDVNKQVAVMRSWLTNYLVATAPGAPPMMLHDGMGKLLRAGSKIVFQMHYTANGTPQKDRSKIGLKFVDAQKIKREVVTRSVLEQAFEIPPYAADHVVAGSLRFREDSLLIELFPHMHLRGKAYRYTAVYPDGKEEILLDIPRYDFGWQNIYAFREPKLMPKGTILRCTAHFDNSADNLSNPDPSQPVRFGDQTWEEMMIGFFNMARVREGLYRDPTRSRSQEFQEKIAKGEITLTDAVREQGAQAMTGDVPFDRWWDQVADLLPQVDRIDVSIADGPSFRYVFIAQGEELPTTMKSMKELPKQVAGMGPLLGLYQYAKKGELVVNNDPAKAQGLEMKFLTKILPSSLHVPIVVHGKPGTVNFWSLDRAAFSPESVEFAQKLVETLRAGSGEVAQAR
jgi:peroxiredoxin